MTGFYFQTKQESLRVFWVGTYKLVKIRIEGELTLDRSKKIFLKKENIMSYDDRWSDKDNIIR